VQNKSDEVNDNNKPGSFTSIRSAFPLSFHAEMHHSVGSFSSRGNMAEKYSKKSGDMSRSSVHHRITSINRQTN